MKYRSVGVACLAVALGVASPALARGGGGGHGGAPCPLPTRWRPRSEHRRMSQTCHAPKELFIKQKSWNLLGLRPFPYRHGGDCTDTEQFIKYGQ